MALEREVDTYAREFEALKPHAGKYVLIHGDDVVEIFESYEDAIRAGYSKFQLDPFMVNQIQTEDYILHVTRYVRPVSAEGYVIRATSD